MSRSRYTAKAVRQQYLFSHTLSQQQSYARNLRVAFLLFRAVSSLADSAAKGTPFCSVSRVVGTEVPARVVLRLCSVGTVEEGRIMDLASGI